jgi:hypothetical protein
VPTPNRTPSDPGIGFHPYLPRGAGRLCQHHSNNSFSVIDFDYLTEEEEVQ